MVFGFLTKVKKWQETGWYVWKALKFLILEDEDWPCDLCHLPIVRQNMAICLVVYYIIGILEIH
jgi:hypothetical protein